MSKSIDGVSPEEVPTGMVCLECATDLKGGTLDKFPVAFCPNCFGVLIDNEGIGNLLRIRRSEYKGPDKTPSPIDQQALKRGRNCPNCRGPMEVYAYGGPGNVVMDSCCGCHMLWMDNGEITKIVKAPGLRN